MQRISLSTPRHFEPGNAVLPVAFVLGIAGFAVLATAASGQAYTALDARIAGWVQGLSLPGFELVSGVANVLTDPPMAIALWLAAMTILVLKGRPIEAIAIFLISGLWIANQLLGMVVVRPSASLTGAVTFYGLLGFLAFSNVRHGSGRVALPVIAVAMIVVASLSRVYTGAHWPTDVLGGYILGFMGVAGIAWLYTKVKFDTLHIPRPWGKKAADPVVEGVTMAGSIASKVYLDWKAGTATKEYHPPLPVRALYRLAFQAPFPYQGRRDALEAAAAKRKIAGLLTKHDSLVKTRFEEVPAL